MVSASLRLHPIITKSWHSLFFLRFIYLFNRKSVRENSSICWFTPQMPSMPGVGQAGTSSGSPHMASRGLVTWAVTCCLPGTQAGYSPDWTGSRERIWFQALQWGGGGGKQYVPSVQCLYPTTSFIFLVWALPRSLLTILHRMSFVVPRTQRCLNGLLSVIEGFGQTWILYIADPSFQITDNNCLTGVMQKLNNNV